MTTTTQAATRLRGVRRVPHPVGRVFGGTLDVAPDAPRLLPDRAGPLAAVGAHGVTARLSEGGGLPRGLPGVLPGVLGVALRVPTHSTPIDVLFTTSAMPPVLRHLPLPRRSFLSGVYTTLLPYRLGGRVRLLGLFPLRRRMLPGRVDLLGDAVTAAPLVFGLAVATLTGPWRPFARLRLDTPLPGDRSFDPVLNARPEAHPAGSLVALSGRGSETDES
ncbi:hypothetical protein [Actinomadura atramentaria]|uniref:hypothetical protein n=1 Tax=Actinomadura atramentaria TaxID=1990 RepID=UPI000365D1B0|nr:hypothetical protein [Actinomadura atramentaria]